MTPSIYNNNDVLRPLSRPLLGAVLLAAFALCLGIHLHGIGGDFLSDDFVHAAWIAEAQGKGELLDWLVKRFYLPLESGNYAYRPVVFASYTLDWICYGTNATGWHFTNLAIHLLNGMLILLLARRLAARAGLRDAPFAAAATAVIFVAIPFAGESTFWPVGRFDLLACFFSLAFLVFLLDARGVPWTRRTLMTLGCLLLALLSKESAMPMIAVGFALVFVLALAEQRHAGERIGKIVVASAKETLRRYWPVILLAIAYFTWRQFLFGSPWKVYPDSSLPKTFAELTARITVLKHVFTYPYGENATLWWLLIAAGSAAWLAGLSAAFKRASFMAVSLTVALFGCFVAYLLAPATSFPIASPNGEGIRNLYFSWAMFSLFAGFAIAHHALRIGLLCGLLVVSFWGQARLVSLWHGAAAEMARVTAAVPALAAQINDSKYAVVLLPDHVGAVPFARNAQGGVVVPPRQSVSYLSKMAGMTPPLFAEWERHLNNNIIGGLKGPGVVFDRTNFLGVYCWIPSRGQFQMLDAKPRVGEATAWDAATMKEAASRTCLL